MMALSFINKQDTVEIIRDQIALILANEVANQMSLAVTAGEDPALWDLKIYTERSNPWELYLNEVEEVTPIVNVWFEDETFDKAASNVVERQKATGVFNIDCYGRGLSADVAAGGHTPGDEGAALSAQRAVRLVRNILMSAENTYLNLPRGTAWDRMPRAITMFQPVMSDNSAQKVVGARLALNVSYNEFSPQIEGETMDLLSIDIQRASDGSVLAEADYSYPLP